MCGRARASVCVHVRVCMCVHVCACMHERARAGTCACIHLRACVGLCVRLHFIVLSSPISAPFRVTEIVSRKRKQRNEIQSARTRTCWQDGTISTKVNCTLLLNPSMSGMRRKWSDFLRDDAGHRKINKYLTGELHRALALSYAMIGNRRWVCLLAR